MVAPLLLAGAAGVGAGLAGSIFGKKKIPNYDTSGIVNAINQGGQEQRNIISTVRPETQKLTDQFRADTAGAQDKATAAQKASGEAYLKNLDPITSRLLQSQTDQLKRTTFGAIPETQQATREALAASGGLQRGVSAESLARVPAEAARQFNEGAANLQQESLKTYQDAMANLQTEESQLIAKNLGIDADTYNTILNTGNQALINELNGLISESKTRTEGLVGAEQFRQTGNLASASADASNQQGLFQSLTNVGGQLLGSGTAPKANGVQTVDPVLRRRQVQQSLAGTATA